MCDQGRDARAAERFAGGGQLDFGMILWYWALTRAGALGRIAGAVVIASNGESSSVG